MTIFRSKRFGWRACPRHAGAGILPAFLNSVACAVFSLHAQAAVIEFFNQDLNNYFITAEPVEQDFIDSGGVGRWQRTGNAFAAGGPSQVCRFYGSLSPGPNSHFYTIEPAECQALKDLQAATPATQKRWNFESNDFASTIPVGGQCAAGLVPVYRAYNNGFARGIDSNHRITSNRAAYLATVAAGSIGEGVVMCAPQANGLPAATSVGVATGSVTSATIGAAGGSVSTPDGIITVSIPAGALAANTVIGIQPITNTAHGRIGSAYRLTPNGQTFLHPVTLRFTYTDEDLEGTAARFLGAAFQTASGHWQWLGAATIDTAAKTVSVNASHFTDISRVRGLQIRPPKKTVKTNGKVGLQVRLCYRDSSQDSDELASLGFDCDLDQGPPGDLSVNEWSVNGRLGGGAVFGTVVGSNATATYTAPASVPIPNPVAVSARVHVAGLGETGTERVVSNITIADDSWTGTGTSTSAALDATAEVIWVLERTENNVSAYRPTGTASIAVHGCIIYNPSVGAIDPSSAGVLFVDYNNNPPTYHGSGLAQWPSIATVTCPNPPPPLNTFANAAFFGGSKGTLGVEAQGVVSADGVTIEGTDTNHSGPDPVTFTWRFTRNQ